MPVHAKVGRNLMFFIFHAFIITYLKYPNNVLIWSVARTAIRKLTLNRPGTMITVAMGWK